MKLRIAVATLVAGACSSDAPEKEEATAVAASCHAYAQGLELSNPTQPVAVYPDGVAVGQWEPTVFSDGNGGVRNVAVWKGLRYGDDTGGDGRWRPPVRTSCDPDIKWATSYASACLQSHQQDRHQCPAVGSEDCLFLNVFVPDPSITPPPPGGYPVMVWIHGGNFEWGSASSPSYRAHNLAAWGVVVVTINYRVGVMGFLAHEAFRAENEDDATGNYGLMDQVAALEWVRDNIHGFAGDTDNVTIFGQSAGGSSVNYHLVSPLSDGLFHRAIAHSGAGGLVVSRATVDAHADAVITRANAVDGVDCAGGVDVADCLRQRSACALAAFDSGSYTPGGGDGGSTYASVDGRVLLEEPIQAIVAGRHNNVSLMHGIDNRDDYNVARQSYDPIPTDAAGYATWCAEQYGDYSQRICDAYPLETYGDPITAIEYQMLDSRYECRQRRVREALSRTGAPPVFAWLFADGLSSLGRTEAVHGDELPYLFANPEATGKTFAGSEWSMALVMQSLWVRFAATGAPGWPAWSTSSNTRVVLENDFGCDTLPDQASCQAAGCKWSSALGCGFWAEVYEGPYRDPECDAIWDSFASLCGDGKQSVAEACDDGNVDDGDGCSSDCRCETAPTCGDQVCDGCETSQLCPEDCGIDCRRNDAVCAPGTICDASATCRPVQ